MTTRRKAARKPRPPRVLLPPGPPGRDQPNPYGTCPLCGSSVVSRERRPNGNDTCAKGHTYPSAHTVKPKRSKYGNVRTEHNGVVYDSKAEAARAKELDEMAAGGLIAFWVAHPKFRLGCPENVYVADALVVGLDGLGTWVEDVKGKRTAKFNRDVKLWRKYGPCNLKIIERGQVAEIVRPEKLETPQ